MHLKKMHKPIERNGSLQSLRLLFSAAKAYTPITNGRSVEVTYYDVLSFVNKKAVWKHLPEYWKTVWKPTWLGACSKRNWQAPWHQHLAAFSSSGCRDGWTYAGVCPCWQRINPRKRGHKYFVRLETDGNIGEKGRFDDDRVTWLLFYGNCRDIQAKKKTLYIM